MYKCWNAPSIVGYLCILSLFIGCSNKRINQLQGSVNSLETQLERYQETAQQESEFTTSSLSELQQEISQAFRDIRYSQTNLESLVEQLSNRLAAVERQTAQMQQKLNQLDTQALDNFNTLNQNIQQAKEESNRNLNQHIENMREIISSIRAEASGLKQQDQSLRSSINSLQSQITTMDQENRKIFDRILKDLGVEAPPSTQQTTASGNTYTVKSGDTLSKIAADHNVTTQALIGANPGINPSLIRVGQTVNIP